MINIDISLDRKSSVVIQKKKKKKLMINYGDNFVKFMIQYDLSSIDIIFEVGFISSLV